MDKHTVGSEVPAPLVEIDAQIHIVTGPFNPRTTLCKPSHFPSPFDLANQGEYLFLTRVGSSEIGCRATYAEDTDSIVLQVFIPEHQTLLPNMKLIQNELARRLGLTVNIDGYAHLWDDDPILSHLPEEMRGARPASPFSLYEFLVICTLLQNTTVRRTAKMATDIAHNLGKLYRFPDGTVLHSLWNPSDLIEFGESRLRDLRLGYRSKTLVRFSEQFHNEPDLEARLLALCSEPNSLRAYIKNIYGVGPASAGYIMFEWFKLVSEFNYISPWERKILSKLLFETFDTPAEDIIHFCNKRWAPYTMLAVHAVFEAIFWRRVRGRGPEWLDELIRL